MRKLTSYTKQDTPHKYYAVVNKPGVGVYIYFFFNLINSKTRQTNL